MGETFQSDIPGNIHPLVTQFASVASNGAASRHVLFTAPQNIRLKSFGANFYGADKTVTVTSYQRLTLVDGGANGTGTTIISSMNPSSQIVRSDSSAFTKIQSMRLRSILHPSNTARPRLPYYGYVGIVGAGGSVEDVIHHGGSTSLMIKYPLSLH